jgi:predicted transcriptional regulator
MSEKELGELLRVEAEHAEQHADAQAPPSTTVSRPGIARSTVYSVRLNQDEHAALQHLADEAGIPSSALVRSWILERVRTGGEAPADIRQLIHDEVRDAVREAFNTSS